MAILILHKDIPIPIPIPIPTKVTLHKDTHPYNTLTQTLKINVPTSWFNPNNSNNRKPIVTGKAAWLSFVVAAFGILGLDVSIDEELEWYSIE
ncbi:hypothetical protein SDJN03_17282, partial [Cucurbita argyrosperma subsp. sororia]